MVQKPVINPFRAVARFSKAAFLAARAKRLWPKIHARGTGIERQADSSVYRKFLLSLTPKRVGRFQVGVTKGSVDGAVTFTISAHAKRSLSTAKVHLFKQRLHLPSWINSPLKQRLFKAKFTLATSIEPEINLPIDRSGKPVCAIMNIQGPSKRKYSNPQEMVEEANEQFGTRWQSFILNELTEHAKSQGCSATALLRPEYDRDTTDANLVKFGASPEDTASIRSQYYATARKAGFKKVEGSKYFWKVFPENK